MLEMMQFTCSVATKHLSGYNNLLMSKVTVGWWHRAAAYSKLGEYEMAINDCKKAVGLDPKYGKAYSRMGYVMTVSARCLHS